MTLYYSLCRRHSWGYGDSHCSEQNHTSSLRILLQQNTVDIPSPATQYIVSISNLFTSMCARGLSQPRDQPDTSVLNVTEIKAIDMASFKLWTIEECQIRCPRYTFTIIIIIIIIINCILVFCLAFWSLALISTGTCACSDYEADI